MPKVHDEAGMRFFFFSNEGSEPPHVHVEYGDGLAKFWLEPVALECSIGLGNRDIRKAREIIEANLIKMLEKWNEYHNTAR